MVLINLFGAPGAGKSTGAAYIFSQLKMAGINAELVTEFAKDKVWEESKEAFNNQAYIFGKQYFRISRCENKVDVIVTDSPLLLSLIYNTDSRLGDDFDQVVRNVAGSYNSMNFFITRTKPYNPIGRNQTEEESNEIADDVYELLLKEGIDFESFPGEIEGYDAIVKRILEEI